MKAILIMLAGLLTATGLPAQSLGLQQLGAIGGEITANTGLSVSHSIGATAATTISSSSSQIRVDQGWFLACDLCVEGSKTTGITSYLNPLISAYPNPTNTMLRLMGDPQHIGSYKLFSTTGQLVRSGMIINQEIDLSDLPNGLYLLRVFGRNDQLSLVTKVRKQ